MENNDIRSLREWAPLTDVMEKIPSRVQKGIFSSDLNITCVDTIPEFIALGTDAGIVFWYNRNNGDVQKLRSEVISPVSCVRIVSSVEYMVAAGNTTGQVSIFQIQKELPADLNLVAPLTKPKPIERYTIRDLHKSVVTCCEWSKNGMKLFSGDKQGIVVLTEFDYQAHLSKSLEILNEAYDIVQLNVYQSYLLVSTVYRAIICKREPNDRWRVVQIGKTDRKVLSNFGAVFLDTSIKPPSIICARPGLRFWIADCNGNVEQTLLFKDAAMLKSTWDIPLLNPGKSSFRNLVNFGVILLYSKSFVITYDNTILYILNLEKLRIEAVARGLRGILDVAVCGKEVFILEGSRSLIRIATGPEPPNKTSRIIFSPLLPPPVPLIRNSLIEFEGEEEAIINAEECFELPPIQHIDLDIPIHSDLDSPTTQKNKAIAEQNKRIEIFDKINEMKFEDAILYRSGVNRKQKKVGKQNCKSKPKGGIVEIGQVVAETITAEISEEGISDNIKDPKNFKTSLTTKPLLMNASFCVDTSPTSEVPILKTEHTVEKVEKQEPVINNTHQKTEQLNKTDVLLNHKTHLNVLNYPIDYSVNNMEVQTMQHEKAEFVDEIATGPILEKETEAYCKHYEDSKNVIRKSESSCSNLLEKYDSTDKMTKFLQFVPYQLTDPPITPETTTKDVQQMLQSMKIPTLWNISVEKASESDYSESQNSSDWELLDASDI